MVKTDIFWALIIRNRTLFLCKDICSPIWQQYLIMTQQNKNHLEGVGVIFIYRPPTPVHTNPPTYTHIDPHHTHTHTHPLLQQLSSNIYRITWKCACILRSFVCCDRLHISIKYFHVIHSTSLSVNKHEWIILCKTTYSITFRQFLLINDR